MQQQMIYISLLIGLIAFIVCTNAASVSFSRYGDVEIYNNGTVWKCDKIICPPNSSRCHVTKKKSPTDASVVIREDTCYSATGEILLQNIENEPIDPSRSVTLDVNSYSSGTSSSHSVSTSGSYGNEFKVKYGNVDYNNNHVQEEISKINEQVQRELEKMRQQIQSSFSSYFSTN